MLPRFQLRFDPQATCGVQLNKAGLCMLHPKSKGQGFGGHKYSNLTSWVFSSLLLNIYDGASMAAGECYNSIKRGGKKALLHLKAQHEPFSYIMHH